MAVSFSKIPILTYLTFVTLFATHYGLTFCLSWAHFMIQH